MKVILPGSFDPPTNGHVNLIHRASSIFDYVHIVVATNPHKEYFFSPDERLEMLRALTAGQVNITVAQWSKLIVDFARHIQANVIVRGVRSMNDFTYEFELGQLNKRLAPEIDTVFLPTEMHVSLIRSSTIIDLIKLGGDVSRMVPESIRERIVRTVQEKFKN